MAYVSLNEDNRIVNVMWDDTQIEDGSEEAKNALLEMFPVHVTNGDLIFNTASHCNEDFIVEDGVARYDPLPESVEKIQEEFQEVIKQAKLDGIIEAVENGVLHV